MNNFNKKLCALLLFNLFLIFSFCYSSYGADSTPVMDNLNDYTYTQIIPEDTYDLINKYESQSNVIDGTFYYFIVPFGFSNGSVSFRTYLIRQGAIKDIYFRFETGSSNGMYVTNLYFYFNSGVPAMTSTAGSVNVRFNSWINKLKETNNIM